MDVSHKNMVYNLLLSSLSSHQNLSLDEIEFSSNYYTSYYFSFPYPPVKNLAFFLLYSSCDFALTFNYMLDYSISNKNFCYLNNLFFCDKGIFVEVFDNYYLTSDHKNQLIIFLVSKLSYYLSQLMGVESDERLEARDNLLQYEILNQCRSTAIFNSCSFPDNVYIPDIDPSSQIFNIYMFKPIDIVKSYLSDQINPYTKSKFSAYTIKAIELRFQKEIAMFKRFLDWYNIVIKI